MQFAHARKLFLFDLSLVIMLIGALSAFVGWSMYNPTVTDLVYLTIAPSQSRILSGEYVTYTITYKNSSPIRLTHAALLLELPQGFILDKTDPINFDRIRNVLDLGSIDPGVQGTLSLSGWFYGTPEIEDLIHAQIQYRQDGKTLTEKKISPHMVFLRGSILDAKVDLQNQIIETGKIPFTATLTNTGKDPLLNISFPFDPVTTIGELHDVVTTRGEMVGNTWNSSGLLPGETEKISGMLVIKNELPEEAYTIEFAPTISIRGKQIPQDMITKKVTVAHPHAHVRAVWDDNRTAAKPDETARFTVYITNNGNITIDSSKIEIPLPKTIVAFAEAARINGGSISSNSLIMTSDKHIQLRSINPGETRNITVLLPILHSPDGGTNVVLAPSVRFSGSVAIAPDLSITASASTAPIKVGTQIILNGEVRYYTAEGDQLGRGPLPPVVGKETKYAALFSVKNTTSDVRNGVLSVVLPSYVTWSGKASVTGGSAPTYIASTRTVVWNIGSISSNATEGLFLELSIIPTEAQRGASPRVVESVQMSGFDTYLEYTLSRTLGSIDSSLSTDALGRGKGTKVQ